MALKKEVEAVLNKQIEKEFDAEITYLGLSIYFEKELFKGFAAWFKKQAAEERTHAMKLVDYILDRSGNPVLPAIAAPKVSFETTLAGFNAALAHERANTKGIYDCLEVAQKANDPATLQMLQWFVEEQVEEEKWAEEYSQMVEKIQKSIGGMYHFDHRVGKAAEAE